MRIIRPSYRIVVPDGVGWNNTSDPDQVLSDYMQNMRDHIERCTRISHRSEDKIADGSAEKLLRFIVLGKGDFSVIEHSMLTVEFVVDRGITHELVRHRLFAFTQESTRFVNYEKKMPPSFIYPQVGVECEHCLSDGDIEWTADGAFHTSGPEHDMDWVRCSYDADWLEGIMSAESHYRALLAKGWRPQEARSVFPNALASKIAVTGNLRQWRHMLIMRTSKETHPQFKQVTVPLLNELKQTPMGWLFEDITPEQSQAEAMSRLR